MPDALSGVEFFSHTEPESHLKFCAAATAAGASLEQVPHPLPGPDGELLQVAIARLGPADATTVAMIISGTHGIEGYAGSAVQIGALHTSAQTLAVDDDVAIVFVHQLNPWGAAWSRKENEDNIELLRHFRYCHVGAVPNPVFAELVAEVGFADATSVEDLIARSAQALQVIDRHGIDAVQQALVQGQSEFPHEIAFHGGAPAWSKLLLDRVITTHLVGATKIAVLDLHTAVGDYGEAVVLDQAPPGSPGHQRIANWFGELTPWDETLEAYAWIADLVPGAEVVEATVEFGTETLDFVEQLIFPVDCWLQHSGHRMDPSYHDHLARYRRFYYPEEPNWMSAVWAGGQDRVRQFLSGTNAWSKA